MKLVAIAALIAVCGAAKLDRTYLPPPSAATAGGSPGSLQTPITRTSEQGDSSGNLPTGSYTNNFEGVIVDAAGAGTRASPDDDQSGLGGPRDSYGSQNSKVGDAAFRGSVAGFRNTQYSGSGFNGQVSGNAGQNFGAFESKSERPQAFKDRTSNIISYANDVSVDNYSYGFESDNGIAVGENGVANNGIQAQGGYSYKGDDGQVYKVTYVADEGGYRPQGAHLPTPPPIPKEILESLEQNAKDEAAGLVDDGSYDAQKYNAEGDYTHHNGGNIQYNGAELSQFAKRPESDATASNTFINQNSQAFGKPGQLGNTGGQNTQTNINGQSNQFGSNFANNQNGLTGSQLQESSQAISGHQETLSTGQVSGQFGLSSSGQLAQFSQTQGAFGSQSSQVGSQNDQQSPVSQFGAQSSQFNSLTSQHGSRPQSTGHSSQFGSQVNQQSESSAPLNGQANQGSISSFAAQTNRPSFGTNSGFNSQQNQFGNQVFKPQGSPGSAEYLPPFNTNNRPSYNKPQTDDVLTSLDSNKDNKSPSFVPLGEQHQGSASSASAFTSASSGGVQPQAIQTLNGIQNQPSRPTQFNSNNGQSVLNNSPTSLQHSGSQVGVGFSTAVKPTSIPSIELTTPLEPNETPDSQNYGSQLNSQSKPSFGSAGSQSSSNQAQPQNAYQNSITANQQQTSHTLSPSFADSRPQGSSQFGSTSPAPAISSITNEDRPQNSQNVFGQVQQNNYYSTQKPSFSQGPDQSYYYNQPQKPFGTPVAGSSQGSRFPSKPSFQPNGVISSQNSQFFNQQSLQSPLNNFPNSALLASAVPTTPSHFTQSQNSFSTNGITQASISPFPSVSPTTSTQYDTTQADRYGSKPNTPSFSSKPATTFGQNPSASFTQNQIQFGQSSSPNNNQPTASLSSSKPTTTYGQTLPTSFTQSQIQFGQSSTNNVQPQTPETNKQDTASTQTQQYEGTVYEYNKPPEVLPAPEQTDSSSNQTEATDVSSKPQENQESNSQESKPQFGTQQTQFGQNTFSSQQSILNQGTKPQFGSQTFKPFGGAQVGQQNTLGPQGTAQKTKPNDSTNLPTNHFTHNQQASFGSISQFGSLPATTSGNVPSFPQVGQNQQTGQQTAQSGVQSFKPFSGVQSSTQFGQNTQTSFGSNTLQNSGPQFSVQPNKPFGSASSFSQFEQVALNQGSLANGYPSAQNNQNLQNDQQPFGTTGSIQNSQPVKPFVISGSQGFQGYPSSKPQFGNQLTLPQFTQSSQQTFGATQTSSQPQNDAIPAKPFGNTPANYGSSNSLKPQFGQNVQKQQVNQGSAQPTETSFTQQSFQSSQFGSATKPQFGAQAQFGQNQNGLNKPYGSASSQAQFGLNSAQASSAVSQPGVQAYKPYGTSSSSNFQSQNKPQFDQAPQSSAVSTTSSPPQISFESFETGVQGSQSQSQASQPHSVPCCKGINKDSAIAPLNVGKPSLAFAQTQSQFPGFQGAQSFNAQSLAGRGEEFGGPRQPPSFDSQTGYHY